MTHIAVQESIDDSAATWMEKVADEEYLAPLGAERRDASVTVTRSAAGPTKPIGT